MPSDDSTVNDLREENKSNATHRCSCVKRSPLPGWPWSRLFLFLLDNVIAGLIIGPLSVIYFRGTSVLMDCYFLPDAITETNGMQTCVPSCVSGWISFAIGNVGLLLVVYCQPILRQRLKINRALDWLLGYHLYTYFVAFLRVCRFRGTYLLLQWYAGMTPVSAWTCLAVGFFGLCFMRSSCNVIFPPMCVGVDLEPNIFTSATRFATKPENRELFLLDNLFSLFLMQLMVCYWRGAWATIGIYLYPDDNDKSAVICLVFGYILHVVLCVVQPIFNVMYVKAQKQQGVPDRMNLFKRYLLQTIVYIFINLMCFTYWRGYWILLGHMLPSQPGLAAGVQHVVGIVGLWLLLAGNSLSGLSLGVDGDGSPETGCLAPNEYIQYFSAYRKRKAEARSVRGSKNAFI